MALGSIVLNIFQNLAAETAAYLTTKHPDYAVLAARIAISNLHKETKKSFSQVVKDLYEFGALFYVHHILRLISFNSKSKERTSSKHDIARDIRHSS